MENTTYNGWTNYATWRVNLEYDLSSYAYNMDLTLNDYNYDDADDLTYQIANTIEDYVSESLEMDCDNSNTLSYALAFISEVSWYEIAEHIVENMMEDEE